MADLLINSLDPRVIEAKPTFELPMSEPVGATFLPPADGFTAGVVFAEDVEGLPYELVRLYAKIAATHAIIRPVENGVLVATVVDLEGAWGEGENESDALANLEDAIVGWVAVKRRVGARMPPMESVDLNVQS